MKNLFLLSLGLILLIGCKNNTDEALPYIGFHKLVDGNKEYHTIPDWTFVNQDSTTVTNKDLKDVVYISDFFFRSCPSICPKVMREMKIIYKEFENNPKVRLVNFTLDPKRDTPSKLKKYASNLGVNTEKWMFLHTDEDIYELAGQYFVPAFIDPEAPGGFDHSGKMILVDKAGHVRSFSEGTDPDGTPKLIADIYKLLNEYEK